jgi:hypothetical protein
MAYRFLYIDDTQNQLESGTINALQDGGEIEIIFSQPDSWDTLIVRLVNEMSTYDGIILDLRLHDNPYEGSNYATYRGSTLASELRTRAKEKVFEQDFPIILISADENVRLSLDQTSLDLFDSCISKNSLENGFSYAEFREELKWLADGYRYLNSVEKTCTAVLNIPSIQSLDARFIDEMNNLLSKPVPVHVLARFIIKEVIGKPCFLINEDYLAARFGIARSSADWPVLVEQYFKSYRYSGAFSSPSYRPRWWMFQLEKFWYDQISKDTILRNLSATLRSELLKAKTTFVSLDPIQKQPKSKSDLFWVICKATHVAIDTIDGFTIAGQDDIYSWQEVEYISIEEALRPTRIELWKQISPIERPRLQKLKTLFERS